MVVIHHLGNVHTEHMNLSDHGLSICTKQTEIELKF